MGCTPVRMDWPAATVHALYMGQNESPRHYLRAWREAKGLTLEQVAERVELMGAERTLETGDLSYPKRMTHASLSRIERGKQPYGQALLEILANIYGTDPASLIMRDPDDPVGLWSIWDRVPPEQRQAALAMLQGLARSGTDG